MKKYFKVKDKTITDSKYYEVNCSVCDNGHKETYKTMLVKADNEQEARRKLKSKFPNYNLMRIEEISDCAVPLYKSVPRVYGTTISDIDKAALIKKYEEKLDKVKQLWGDDKLRGERYVKYAEQELEAVKKGGREGLLKFYEAHRYDSNEPVEKISAKDFVLARTDAMNRCISLGKQFIEHFDKIYSDPTNQANNHWIKEMCGWWDSVKQIKLKSTNKPILNGELRDWFFTAGANPQDFMHTATNEELSAYDSFITNVINGVSVEDAIREAFVKDCNTKMSDGVDITKEPGMETPKYVFQSTADPYLYLYVGNKYAMKEGRYTYNKYKLNGITPEQVKSDLLTSGWKQVSHGPASVIDCDETALITNKINDAAWTSQELATVEKYAHRYEESVTNILNAVQKKIASGKSKSVALEEVLDNLVSGVNLTDAEQADFDTKNIEAESAVKSGIKAELTTTDDYSLIIEKLESLYKETNDEKYKIAADAVRDINREEYVHAGEFSEILSNISPESGKAIEEGMLEVKSNQEDLDVHDAKKEYVINWHDTYHKTKERTRVDANNIKEAIHKFGDLVALGGIGTANAYVISISPNDGYIALYGKVSDLLKQF